MKILIQYIFFLLPFQLLAQAKPISAFAKVKLDVPGYKSEHIPEVRWIDPDFNGIVRFGLGVEVTDGSIATSRMDSITDMDNKQWIMCDSVVRLIGKLNADGLTPVVEDGLARGLITFSNPNPLSAPSLIKKPAKENATRVSPTRVDIQEFRYPITVSAIPFRETGRPDGEKYTYVTSYTAYIDKSGKYMRVDSTGAMAKETAKNRYSWANCNCTSIGIAYQSKAEADAILVNYLANKRPGDYHITNSHKYVNVYKGTNNIERAFNGTASLHGWELTTKSGAILSNSHFATCANPNARDQTTSIRYIGSNRYWVEESCTDGQHALLLDDNGKILRRFDNKTLGKDSFYKAGYLILNGGIIINLKGLFMVYDNSKYRAFEILDDTVALVYSTDLTQPLGQQTKTAYLNFLTTKIIYAEGDYESSGRVSPIAQ